MTLYSGAYTRGAYFLPLSLMPKVFNALSISIIKKIIINEINQKIS